MQGNLTFRAVYYTSVRYFSGQAIENMARGVSEVGRCGRKGSNPFVSRLTLNVNQRDSIGTDE